MKDFVASTDTRSVSARAEPDETTSFGAPTRSGRQPSVYAPGPCQRARWSTA